MSYYVHVSIWYIVGGRSDRSDDFFIDNNPSQKWRNISQRNLRHFCCRKMAREFAGNFYKTKAWKNTRETYARSVGGLCEICWQNGLIVAGEIVHHKIPLNSENINNPHITLDPANLQLVCRNCHAMLHKNAENGRRYRVDSDGNVIISSPLS